MDASLKAKLDEARGRINSKQAGINENRKLVVDSPDKPDDAGDMLKDQQSHRSMK
jgi:hypothetical protein